MNRFFRKTVSFLLVILMFSTMLISSYGYDIDDVTLAAADFIISHEGVYTSILMNDNGAVSLGKVGWHGPRALVLLQRIIAANESQALSILGSTLYNEIISCVEVDWNYRTFTYAEKEIVTELLATDESRQQQDQMALDDIKGYIVYGQSMGLNDAKALVYFADLHNQMGGWGAGRVLKAAIEAAGSAENVTLKILYDAAMDDRTASSSPTRRREAYEYCASLSFGELGPDEEFRAGEYVTTASALRVRSGPGTNYGTVTDSIPEGTTVTVLEVSGIWGKVVYKGATGWISLMYADCKQEASTQEPTTQAPSTEKPVTPDASDKYDVNGNGLTDAADARIVLRASAGMGTLTASQQAVADADGNGKITAADARLILRAAAKIQ